MIREVKEIDFARLTEMEKELFPVNPWPYSQFLYEYKENPFSTIFVYEKNNTAIGYLDLWVMYENAEIANIATDLKYQRQGIAQQLMNKAVTFAQKKGL